MSHIEWSRIRRSQQGHIKILNFSPKTMISAEDLSRGNNKLFKNFIHGEVPYYPAPHRKAAYILDPPNIFIGPSHMAITKKFSRIDIDYLDKRFVDDRSPAMVMGWLCVCDLPKSRLADEKALGLSGKRRSALLIDGFSDLFKSIGAPKVRTDYFRRQTEALWFFPSFLSLLRSPLPAIMVEEPSADAALRISEINDKNVWKVILSGLLLKLEIWR